MNEQDRIAVDGDVLGVLNAQSGHTPQPVDAYRDVDDGVTEVDLGYDDIEGNNGHGVVRRLRDTEAGKALAREMQQKSRGKYREARALRSAEARDAAADILEEVKTGLQIATSRAPNASITRMADDIVRMMASLVLRGGELFTPVNGKEATEMAKHWAGIASQHRLGKAAHLIDASSREDPTAAAIQGVKELMEKAKRRQNTPATPIIAGQTIQIDGDGEPDIDPYEPD